MGSGVLPVHDVDTPPVPLVKDHIVQDEIPLAPPRQLVDRLLADQRAGGSVHDLAAAQEVKAKDVTPTLETYQPVDILLVEDNPNDVELAIHALKKHNLANRIQVVRDGAEALDYLFARGAFAHRNIDEAPRVVLLDLKLAKVDGLEVLRQIKSDPRTRKIPVVILTSSREERDVVESYNLGVNSYILKPVDFQQFSEAVRTIGLYWLLLNHPPKV